MKRLLLAAVSVLALAAAGLAYGQDGYPGKPIHLIVGFPPGTATDIVARQVSERLARNTGWTVIVENKVGQAGSLGASEVAQAAPDGYTLLLSANGPLATNPNLYDNVRYKTLQDFTPIARLVELPYVLVVNASSPYRSVQDVVAAARAAPGKLNYSSPGSGSTGHLIAATFAMKTGSEYTHVPYKGSAESLTGMLSGSIDMLFETSVVTVPLVRAGKLRPLAVTTGKRIASLPDVPTLQEAGVPLEMAAWLGIVGPARMPAGITGRLNAELNKALQEPDMRESLGRLGAEVTTASSREFSAFLAQEYDKWGQAVRDSGARVE